MYDFVSPDRLLDVLHEYWRCHSWEVWNRPEYQYELRVEHGEGYCDASKVFCTVPFYAGRLLPNDGKDVLVVIHRSITISRHLSTSLTPPIGGEHELFDYAKRYRLSSDIEWYTTQNPPPQFLWIDPKIWIIISRREGDLPDILHNDAYWTSAVQHILWITPGWHNACWDRSPLFKSHTFESNTPFDKIISNSKYASYSITSSSLVELGRVEFVDVIDIYKLVVHFSWDGNGTEISSAEIVLEASEDGTLWTQIDSITGAPASVDHRTIGYTRIDQYGNRLPRETPLRAKYIRLRAKSDGTNTLNIRIHIMTAWVRREEYYSYGVEPDPWHDCRHTLCW